MQSRKQQVLPGVDLETLDREHSTIHRQYIELDDAILHGHGSPRIVEAARTLAQYMLLHFVHEDQFQKKISFPVLEDQRNAWKKNLTELLQIDAGLKRDEVYSALRLRAFCKNWIYEHLYVETVEFEMAALALVPKDGRIQAR
jgi:hemerythrin-like metal-binding protein